MVTRLNSPETPDGLAALGQAIDFSQKIADFPRLCEALQRELAALETRDRPRDWDQGLVTGTAEFCYGDAESRDVVARVEASVAAPLRCQRCLKAFDVELDVRNEVLLAFDGRQPQRGDLETWELDGSRFRPLDLVDEMLVMSLPFAAKHEDDERCRAEEAASGDADTQRPFADLKAQMAATRPSSDEPED